MWIATYGSQQLFGLQAKLWKINLVARLFTLFICDQDPSVTVAVKLIHLQRSKRMDRAIPLLLIMTTIMISAIKIRSICSCYCW